MTETKLVHVGRMLRPGGGPAGYLYNLKKISKSQGSPILKVFAITESEERSGSTPKKANPIILALPYAIRKIYAKTSLMVRAFLDLASVIQIKFKLGRDFPVFHDQMLAYWYYRIFSRPYCVMPHQPVELAHEADDIYAHRYNLKRNDIYPKILEKELSAYRNATAILCPTEYSLDDYFVSNTSHRKTLEKTPKHIVVSTVTVPRQTVGRIEARKALQISPNDVAIGFVGRYNRDKGYDRFLSIAKRHRGDKSWKFFSAGAGEICDDQSVVCDLGWRKDIADVIVAMDLLVVPNRATFFDLLPIESLILGTPVAVSAVGGNKWLLGEVKDNCIQEILFETADGKDNLSQIVGALPKRARFKSSGLSNYINDTAFIKSHEKIQNKIK